MCTSSVKCTLVRVYSDQRLVIQEALINLSKHQGVSEFNEEALCDAK